MSLFSDWSDSINPERREILFENRNRNYGAYFIRKNYTRSVVFALLINVLFLIVVLSFPVISSFFQKSILQKTKVSESITLEEPPPIDKITPPPPTVLEPPPLIHMIKFTPPVVVDDETLQDPPPTQDEVKNVQVSTISQEGLDLVALPDDPMLTSHAEEDKVFTIVEEMPAFPGGDKELLKKLAQINYPTAARENGISGAVYLTFVVEKDGKIKEAKILKGIGGGCDEEALRVLLTLPDWRPGRQNGRPVAVRSSVRVNFTLQ
jgi:protein TonB